MAEGQLFHVLWTSSGEYPVWNKNGGWEKLKTVYSVLEQQEISSRFSQPLPKEYVQKTARTDRILFDEEVRGKLTADIMELCQKDRILEGISLEMVRVTESSVELLVYCHPDSLKQKISRLKSRTATLLSFAFPDYFPGKGTWGKGFWFAAILNKEALAASIIRQ